MSKSMAMGETKKIKICVFTGSRADYGILSGLMYELKRREEFTLQVMASGSHLSKAHGETFREIEEDGFAIDARVSIPSAGSGGLATAKAIGGGIIKFSRALEELGSGLALALGDRFETFALASAAVSLGVPLVHLHGGELTEGSMDEYFRHAITKLARLHFASTEEYRQRIIRMGERPGFVFNSGALGVENVKKTKLLSRSATEKALGFRMGERCVAVAFHPQTVRGAGKSEDFGELLRALDARRDVKIIFTMPNADAGCAEIAAAIRAFTAANPERAVWYDSLGRKLFFSVLNCVDALVGNSSSGIIEAPSFGIGTVNIGDRQTGRARPASVIDCRLKKNDILKAFDTLYSESFRKTLKNTVNIYERKNTASFIAATIARMYPKLKASGAKKFYDGKL